MRTFLMKHRFMAMLAAVAIMVILAGFGVVDYGILAFIPVMFGATSDLTGAGASMEWSRTSRGGTIRKRVTIPLAKQIAADILQVIKVKAGTFASQVQLIMVTPSTGTALAVNVGDGATAAGYDAAVDLKGAAGTETHGAPGTDAFLTAGGKYYAAEDTIDLAFSTVTAPAGDVVVDVIAHVEDVSV